MFKQMLAAVIALSFLVGCNGKVKVSDPAVKLAIVATTVAASSVGCNKLSKSLNPSERVKLYDSLVAASKVINTDNIADVEVSIAAIDKNVAPYAPAIAAWVVVGKSLLPAEYKDELAFDVVNGVVSSCLLVTTGVN